LVPFLGEARKGTRQSGETDNASTLTGVTYKLRSSDEVVLPNLADCHTSKSQRFHTSHLNTHRL
jgi:hypothetical protein